MAKEVKTQRAGFGGAIPDHKRIPEPDWNDEKSVEQYRVAKWLRGHEQRELKAYLKGKQLFSHGRRVVLSGYAPVQFRVREIRKPLQTIQ